MEIFKVFHIEAAHRLPNLPASHKCSRLHGHSFRVEIHIPATRGAPRPAGSWTSPISRPRSLPVFEALDHRYLNDVPGPRQSHQRDTWLAGYGSSSIPACRICRKWSSPRPALRAVSIGAIDRIKDEPHASPDPVHHFPLPGIAPLTDRAASMSDVDYMAAMAGMHAADTPTPSPAAMEKPALPVMGTDVAYATVGGKEVHGYLSRPARCQGTAARHHRGPRMVGAER